MHIRAQRWEITLINLGVLFGLVWGAFTLGNMTGKTEACSPTAELAAPLAK